MTPDIPSVTVVIGTGGSMGVGGNINFVTSGDVVTYEVGVPGKWIGFGIGAMRTTGTGTCTCVVGGSTVSCCPGCMSLVTVIGCITER